MIPSQLASKEANSGLGCRTHFPPVMMELGKTHAGFGFGFGLRQEKI